MTMSLWRLAFALVITSVYDNACATGKFRSAAAEVTSCKSVINFLEYEELPEAEGVQKVLKCAMACQKFDSCVLAVFISRNAASRCLPFKLRTVVTASTSSVTTTLLSTGRSSNPNFNIFAFFMSYLANATLTKSNWTNSFWDNTTLLNSPQWTVPEYQGQANNNQTIQEQTTPQFSWQVISKNEDYQRIQYCKVIKFRI